MTTEANQDASAEAKPNAARAADSDRVAPTAEEQRLRLERRRVKARRMARFGYPVFRSLAATWSQKWVGIEHILTRGGSAAPCILTTFHRSLLGGSWVGRNQGFGVMVSQHGDGELISDVLQRIGFETIRGSSSRGGARALIQMMRVPLRTTLVLTVDGPRGPAEEVKDGVLVLAARSGRLISPTGFGASRSWRAKSWDRLIVPKPFARIALYTTEPLAIPPECVQDPDARAHWRQVVRERLVDAHERAQELVSGRD